MRRARFKRCAGLGCGCEAVPQSLTKTSEPLSSALRESRTMLHPNHDGKRKHCGGSPAEYCKAQGLTVAEVARCVGKPRQTLINWHRDSPDLFRVVVAGVVAVKLKR